MRYSGDIENWFYSEDWNTFYYYSTYWDQYFNPNREARTYFIVDTLGYSAITVERYDVASSSWKETNLDLISTSNNERMYEDTSNIPSNRYRVITRFIPDDGGTVDLFNTVSIDRYE